MKQVASPGPTIGLTPQGVEHQRNLARALVQQGTSAEPVGHWTQALARAAQSGVGALNRDSANAQERQGQQAASNAMAAALAGGSLENAAQTMMANPYAAGQGQQLAGSILSGRQTAARQSARDQRKFDQQRQLIRERAQAPTTFQRNYDFARSQGFQGTPADFKRSGATQVNVGAGEKKFDQELGKGMAELFMDAQKAGTKAEQDLADLQVMEQYATDPNLYTGTGGALVHDFKKTAGTLFGVDVEGVASGEGLQRLSNKIALSFKDQLPGPMSNADREFLQALPANLNTSPEGNRQVIQLGIAKKRWEIERALAVRQFQQQNGRLTPEVYAHIADVDRKWGAQMSGLVQQMRGQTAAPNRSPVVGFPEVIKRGGRIRMNADGTFSQ